MVCERDKEIPTSWPSRVLIAQPHGFCAGVVRAIEALQNIHNIRKGRVYCYHEIIHNKSVVRGFRKRGVEFIDDVSNVPERGIMVISAHGISPVVRRQASERRLQVFDATCPLVDKPHREVKRYVKEGYEILYICHQGHDEAIGLIGEAPEHVKPIETIKDAQAIQVRNPEKLALITQTTLSQDDTADIRDVLRARFPQMQEPPKSDICYATQHRQDAVKKIVEMGAEVVIVVGSKNSSNSRRLTEVATRSGKGVGREIKTYLVDSLDEVDPEWVYGAECVGLTAGASAPEDKFEEIMVWFRVHGSRVFEGIRVADESRIFFAPPKGLEK